MAIDPATGKEAVVEGAAEDKTLLDGGETGGEQKTPEQIAADNATAEAAKVAAETDNKRILETEDANLSAEDLAKKPALVKAAEDKRLLETPDDKLTAEEKVTKAALVKAQEDLKKTKETGAPEKYEDFKLPTGVEMVNQPLLEEFKTTAKELNLSQAGAQKIIDLQVKHLESINKSMQDNFIAIKNQWKAETQAELKANLKADLLIAGKAIEVLGTPELKKMLNETGVGNHKELVKFFIAAGKLVSEDKIVDGKNKGTAPQSDGGLFYGNSMK